MAERPLSLSEFASIIAGLGGELVGFCDEAKGITLSEEQIKALVEAEHGRSNQEQKEAL